MTKVTRPAPVLDALADLVASVVKVLDDAFASTLASMAPDAVSCFRCQSPGCCLVTVCCTWLEGVWIARTLRDRHGPPSSQFRKRLLVAGKHMLATDRDTFFQERNPCVFLDANQRCTIYPVRPVACRSYYVNTPPEDCLPQSKNKIGYLYLPIVDEVTHNLLQNTLQCMGVEDVAPTACPMGPLPLMVWAALRLYQCTSAEQLNRVIKQTTRYFAVSFTDMPAWLRGRGNDAHGQDQEETANVQR